MATFFSNTIQGTNATDAQYRASISFIHGALTGGGWVQTADAGQVNFATQVKPAANNTKAGFAVYRMNDALQATAPVFMRLDFGNAGNGSLGLWPTIGTGSDGAGGITGKIFDGGAIGNPPVQPGGLNNAAATNSYASASTSRFQMMLYVNVGLLVMSLERAKDSTGADIADGLLFAYGDGNGNIGALSITRYLKLAGASPPPEFGISCILSNYINSAFTTDVGIGIPAFFKGIAQPFGTGLICVNDGDFLSEATVVMNIYGQNRSYQLQNGGSCLYIAQGNQNRGLRNNTRIGIRYD